MNITIVDLSDIENPKAGDEVVVISGSRADQNSAENLAELCHTIPHEILVHIPAHLRRIVI